MIVADIPGKGRLTLRNAVFDFNGTLALDGILLPGVEERLNTLSDRLDTYIITADTFGTVESACSAINGKLQVLTQFLGASEKLEFIRKLDMQETVTVGNGANDSLMLADAALGIVVIGSEGASVKALSAADVVVTGINDGIDLLLNPKRLLATLRG